MKKWEYLTISRDWINVPGSEFQDRGGEGWELVLAIPHTQNGWTIVRYFFKREIEVQLFYDQSLLEEK